MDTFDLVPHVRDLAIAYGLAVPIGWDREREDRTAGLRTFPLVAIASCGFIQASEHFASTSNNVVSGAVEGLIAGMGFIGGGTILKEGLSVRGTATAASLWPPLPSASPWDSEPMTSPSSSPWRHSCVLGMSSSLGVKVPCAT